MDPVSGISVARTERSEAGTGGRMDAAILDFAVPQSSYVTLLERRARRSGVIVCKRGLSDRFALSASNDRRQQRLAIAR